MCWKATDVSKHTYDVSCGFLSSFTQILEGYLRVNQDTWRYIAYEVQKTSLQKLIGCVSFTRVCVSGLHDTSYLKREWSSTIEIQKAYMPCEKWRQKQNHPKWFRYQSLGNFCNVFFILLVITQDIGENVKQNMHTIITNLHLESKSRNTWKWSSELCDYSFFLNKKL